MGAAGWGYMFRTLWKKTISDRAGVQRLNRRRSQTKENPEHSTAMGAMALTLLETLQRARLTDPDASL